jgi:hypothetical protein
LPVTSRQIELDREEFNKTGTISPKEEYVQTRGPFLHGPDDDDSSAVTFWGKQDLRRVLRVMHDKLDEHYGERKDPKNMWEEQARAWSRVFDTLHAHNPTFATGPGPSGELCAVAEIERLQKAEKELAELKKSLALFERFAGLPHGGGI